MESDRTANRRREPRLRTGAVVRARCIDPLLRVLAMRNLSRNGFAIETDVKVLPGLQMSFEFKTVTGLTIHARAMSVHCRLDDDSARCHVSGWRFVDGGTSLDAAQELVDILSAEAEPEGGGGPDAA